MDEPRYDVIAIGNAIVDVISPCEDELIDELELNRGGMTLVDTARARELYDAMGSAKDISGGSAANTLAGLAALGAQCAFIGQVAEDQFGQVFAHDIHAVGIDFDVPARAGDPPTAQCLIFVTPDGQRTMNTCPGASHELDARALDRELIASASILFLEGYLFGPEKPRAAMMEAIKVAHGARRKVAFTLSESVCIAGRKESFGQMIESGGVDLLFCNDDEALQLTGRTELKHALTDLSIKVPTVVVTKGADGAIAIENGERIAIPAAPVGEVFDTTGAGDLFAAGFLTARCKGASLERCLWTGAIAAAEVIQHYGARPIADLKPLVQL